MSLRHRRKLNPRQVHIVDVDNIRYVCKGLPEMKDFYLLGVLK